MMRIIYIVFLLSCLALVAGLRISQMVTALPEEKVAELVSALKSNDVMKAAAMFGDVYCSCPPQGGYMSYLMYESGQNPNLAFLLGHNFTTGRLSKRVLKENVPDTLPWEHPESVAITVPLSFDRTVYSPCLLPIPLAFGKEMNLEKFQEFLADPNTERSKGLSLRLRPGVSPGLIQGAKRGGEVRADHPDRAPERESGLNVRPQDPGCVIDQSGRRLTVKDLESRLPRLTSVLIHLKVARRGILQAWQISRFNFSDAVVQIAGHDAVKLTDGNGR